LPSGGDPDHDADMGDAPERAARWEEQALARTLAPARARSAAQVRRVVAAARELAAGVGPAFTVQQVAARAGVSLKSLYRSFPGKDELLLAVFEEDNRLGAGVLAARIAAVSDPLERVRSFVTGLFDLSTGRPDRPYISLVMREYFRLAQDHGEQVEHVLAPFVDLLTTELEAAQEQGALQLTDARRDAAAVFLLAVSHLCPLVLSDAHSDPSLTAHYVADFCIRALGGTP
jgi:AcrR family transcriptional regulator